LHEAIDARTESLASLRELGPPDLVHLVKQPIRNAGKQVSQLHMVSVESEHQRSNEGPYR
jgi:hypothetical protein